VYFEEWDDPMISAIEWVSELIEIAGGHDIFSDRSRGKLAKERFVQPEEVIAAAPEVMLASWCGKPFDPEAVRAREGWGDIPALNTGRMHEIASAEILQPGPACLTAGLAAIERSLIGAVEPSS
jgi:iron complex transport system substrate-binding protein